MALKLTDEIAVRVKNSGGLQDYVPVSELNDLISTEEDGRLGDLETAVGTYAGGSDLSTDVSTLQTEVETATTGLLDRTTALEDVATEAASYPTLAQTYAIGTLTLSGNPTAGDTITIGSGEYVKTYTFRAELTEGGLENEILIAATDVPNDTCINIEKAINDSGTEGVHYGTGTTAHAQVVATAGTGTVSLTVAGSTQAAAFIGTAGNAIGTTESATNTAFGGTTLSGGLDITPASAGKIIVGSTAIYIATSDCTTTVSNWKRIDLILANTANAVEKDLSTSPVTYTASTADTCIVVTATHETDSIVNLPAATGSQRKLIIKNLGSNDLKIEPNGAETIDGEENATIATTNSVIIIDYITGKWIIA